ncbi:MAG: radical SAM protein, partial [Xanthobacteraceae bacterium]
LQHLEARRRQNAVCGGCGQLSHCLPDNIDAHRLTLLAKFKEAVNLEPSVVAPGGIAAGIPVTEAAA